MISSLLCLPHQYINPIKNNKNNQLALSPASPFPIKLYAKPIIFQIFNKKLSFK